MLSGHALVLGGNAVLFFQVAPRETDGISSRSQAYHLLCVSGDVVLVEPEEGEDGEGT